jgi:type IV pilus assembly protein PilW
MNTPKKTIWRARREPFDWRGSERGFNLVELMVSMAIGLVILGALVALFVNTSGSNREMARANSLIENGRLAMQLLESDVAHAGYWGGHIPEYDDLTLKDSPTDAPTTAVPDPCQDYDDWDAAYVRNLLAIPVQVYEEPTVLCAGIVVSQQGGTDILVVRHAELCVPGAATGAGNCESDLPAGRLYMQVSRCLTDLAPYVFGTAGFNLFQRNCVAAADKRKFVSSIYYVRDYAVTEGDGIPTLMRAQFDLDGTTLAHQPAVPLIEGIEGFHVEIGVDNVSKTNKDLVLGDFSDPIDWEDEKTRETAKNRGDGVPDEYRSCTKDDPCEVVDLMNATAVRLNLLVRSREETQGLVDDKEYDLGFAGGPLGPYNDGFKRHVFVTTVRLPNIASRRETP